ncbi:EPIDERMAL PATTERNING FACTOR-like protein 2 [Linum perenne]
MVCCCIDNHSLFAASSLLLLLISSFTQQIYNAEGRSISMSPSISQVSTVRPPRIGSRPPRCEKRCRSCEQCEAIQVPVNPKVNRIRARGAAISGTEEYGRRGGEYSYDYKPLSWKCKCGNLIFNP